MNKTDAEYQSYVQILREELIPAQGCTEPIAIAYAAAKARCILGTIPERCVLKVSGNIIKNVKSVIVPNTGSQKGIEAAVAAGIIAGKPDAVLEVVADIKPEEQSAISDYLSRKCITVLLADTDSTFYIDPTVYSGSSQVNIIIADKHTNIVSITKNGASLQKNDSECGGEVKKADRSLLSIEKIIDFAESADLKDIADVLERQISYNMAIAQEGMTQKWGAEIGRIMVNTYGNDVKFLAQAYAAAGSDARMSGCELPVIIVSGSGNQGITASVPVIIYAQELGSSHEDLLRGLIVSDLVAIYEKCGIGCLSAFCGAVCAGSGAACGIAYLHGERFETIAHTIVNGLAIVSGMVCDGAKPSCAAKIALAVNSGLMGYSMYKNGQQFWNGDGIVTLGVDNTIANVGRMAREGMKETDREILKIMIGDNEKTFC